MDYAVRNAGELQTPALLVYPDVVDSNIRATLRMMKGDANRWRPHIKTAKIASVIRQMIGHGVRAFKCATTLELLMACEAGAEDILLAFPVTGANAARTAELAHQFPGVRISVLVESREQLRQWIGTRVGVFIDVNPGMNRTGIGEGRGADILELARSAGTAFRGLHYYDGHAEGAVAQAGYDRLLEIVHMLAAAAFAPGEVITSGTPAAPAALAHAGLSGGAFQHRVSPGTVVYNDVSSLAQLPGFGYQAAVLVLSSVISHPAPGMFTCDAGHKSVSADAGVPTCQVVGHSEFVPLKPSEEHLPVRVEGSGQVPAIGSMIYLLPRHVCPTVNQFDEAAIVVGGEVCGFERVAARGHESGLRAAFMAR